MIVSILIPVYNSGKYLRQTIQSALDQSWHDKEIIIVDDGSTDNSLSIAKSFEVHGNVKVFTQLNGGACKARNRAFAESTGDYIQYLDADDLLSPNKIESQMKLVQTYSLTNTILSCSWARFQDETDLRTLSIPRQPIDKDWSHPVEWLTAKWSGPDMSIITVWLTPRKLIEEAGAWNETLSINQDGEFFCRVLLLAKAITFSPDAYAYYRSGISTSISQQKSKRKVSDLLYSYKLYEEHVLKKWNNQDVKQALAVLYFSFIYIYFDTYPDLVHQARTYVDELGIKKSKVGGKYFKWLADRIGFENALRVRSWLRRWKDK